MKDLKIIFAGTPDFAATSLTTLINAGCNIVAVLTQPDRRSGRGKKVQSGPVKLVAEEHNLSILQPGTLKEEEIQQTLKEFDADLMIVVAYGQILPKEVLETPRLGCWNVHASLLPRWRGAAPIQRAILEGDTQSGVCIMQMDEGLDTGDVLARDACPVTATMTGGELHDLLAEMGAQALLSCLQHQPDLVANPQEQEGVCYAHKLNKAEADLDLNLSSVQVLRKIRAFNPWPVARTPIDGELIRIWGAQLINNEGFDQTETNSGDIISASKKGIVIACGEGTINITKLQRPGGKVITAADWLNAKPEFR